MKTLGEAAADVDDLGAWVTKSRALEEARKAEERAKADKAARMLALQVCLCRQCCGCALEIVPAKQLLTVLE